jgi:sugar-specific transcriptional regulator TrmB
MDKIKKTLEKIGLNKNEIKIYLTSLSIGQSPASIL